MRVPVLPSPALQWTAIAPELGDAKCLSQVFRKSATISSLGFEPSGKNKSQ
jgi:hypothetical protein